MLREGTSAFQVQEEGEVKRWAVEAQNMCAGPIVKCEAYG